ncbi:hypothetical protein KCG43_12660 [Photobacterium sp. WH24]|uniref:hypothetical protein n=1 Tax=Photobacterium sp. WH24 TaxID=2827237 RepID=UPI001C43FC4B|nr:hypothetical protein [Photobacterium sp. WH24]MBV7262848.1 hypothetical protein [Photobacterium sp. WH24]
MNNPINISALYGFSVIRIEAVLFRFIAWLFKVEAVKSKGEPFEKGWILYKRRTKEGRQNNGGPELKI